MNRFATRTVALLLAFILCLGTLSGITMTADAATTVDYVTGNASSKYTNVIKNWGNRGETATYLSQNAEAFYQTNNTSYAQLSALSGAASTADVPNSELYSALQTLMQSNHKTTTTYDETKVLYAYTDCENSGNPSTISSFYSGVAIGPDWDGTWNREHTWPNSKSDTGSNENDIMMLRPTATSENSSRGNDAYGESAACYDPNEVSGGKYNLHGDVARVFLYVYVRWGITNTAWGSGGVMESKDVLLKWMEEDPVDTWELGRNDSVESITGTRNVFVDYPELAFKLFNAEVPAITTPSGEAGKSSAYTITAQSNNAAYGTVSTNGSTITAVPVEGYEVAGYTVVSGNATVTRNGDQFTVSATSDCTIQIDFQAKTAAPVSFLENGTTTGTQNAYVGDVITLPTDSVTVPADYTFLGWVTSELSETTAMPTIYSAGSSYTLEGTTSFYALYSRTDANGSGTSSVFKPYSGEVTEGDYLIVYNGDAMKAEDTGKSRLNFMAVTATDNCVNNPDKMLVWHVAPTTDGWTLYNESTASYAASTGTKSQATLSTTEDDKSTWTVSGTETYEFVNKANSAKGVNATLRKNGNYGFACYAKGASGGPMTLYKAVSGTVYYTTTAEACKHANTTQEAEQAATCTESGFTAGVYCSDCKSYIEGHQVIEALGHSYDEAVTPPTKTEQGYTTFTCSRCGDSYVGNYVEALGETYTVSFAVPNGAAAIEKQACNTSGITLPTPDVPTGDHSYTFAGWAEQSVTDTTEEPVLYAAGSSYVAQADTTLYAVYTYTVGGTGSTQWVLVTDASKLTEGTQLVIASNSKGTVASNIASSVMQKLDATFSADMNTISTLPDGAVVLTLGGTSGAWTLKNSDGQLLGATAVKKLAWDKGTTTWDISIASDGNATIQNGTSTYGRFLYNNGSPRFTTYTSNTSASMLLPQLYMQEGSAGTTYYTSLDGKAEPELFNIPSVTMNLGNSLSMIFYVPVENVTDGDYAQFTKVYADDRGTVTTTVKLDPSKLQTKNYNGVDCYLVGFDGIAAKEMNDNVTCVICNSADVAISKPATMSVKAYAEASYNAGKPALNTLLADLLNYGAEAQKSFGYDTGNPANAGVSAELMACATNTIDLTGKGHFVAGQGIAPVEMALILKNNTRLVLYYTDAGVELGMNVKVSYTNHNDKPVSEEGKVVELEGKKAVIIESLSAADFETDVTVEISNGTEAVSSCTVNMAQYCEKPSASTADISLALAKYCLSAYNFFHPVA